MESWALSGVARVNDAEAVSFWIREHDEVGILRIQIPRHTDSAETDEARDLGGLFGGGIDDKIEMNPRMLLGWGLRSLEGDTGSFARGRDQDREFVFRFGEANGRVVEGL